MHLNHRGLEPATNGFASGGSRRCRMMPVMLCGSTTLVRTAFLARTVFSHRIPFILAEQAMTRCGRRHSCRHTPSVLPIHDRTPKPLNPQQRSRRFHRSQAVRQHPAAAHYVVRCAGRSPARMASGPPPGPHQSRSDSHDRPVGPEAHADGFTVRLSARLLALVSVDVVA
jgi:hypothetical protein